MLNDTGDTPGASVPASVLARLAGRPVPSGHRARADAALTEASLALAALIAARDGHLAADSVANADRLHAAVADVVAPLLRAMGRLSMRTLRS